jgi:hypothetical protein
MILLGVEKLTSFLQNNHIIIYIGSTTTTTRVIRESNIKRHQLQPHQPPAHPVPFALESSKI